MSGSADDPAGKYGVASLTAAMLTEGAGSRTSLEIADAIDFLGADLSAPQRHRLGRRPAARAGRAARRRAADHGRRRAAARRSRRRSSNGCASSGSSACSRRATIRRRLRRWPSRACSSGRRTASARRRMGTADTIKAFTPDDLRAFYYVDLPARQCDAARRRRHRARPGAAAARVELRRVEAAAELLSRAWRCRPRRQPARREVYLVDKPGAPQSQIRIGWVGVPRVDARLLPASGDEHGARRVVQLAAEPQPAREARLHLRRGVRRSTCASPPGRSRPRPACRPTRRPKRCRSSSTS